MFDATDEPGPTPAPPPSDPRIEMAERHLLMLEHVASWAMDAAQASAALLTASGWRSKAAICEEQGVWSSESAKQVAMRGHRDAADSFHSVTRALRLTMALETATAERLHDLRAGVAKRRREAGGAAGAGGEAAAPDEAPETAEEPRSLASMGVYRDTVCELVGEAIAAEVADDSLAREMRAGLRERLSERDLFGPLMFRPLREVVARICADIGLAPDWSQWTGEGWSADYTPPRGPDWPLPWKPRRARVRQALARTLAGLPPEPAVAAPPPHPRQ
jgi:hypothetical protein